MSVLSLEGCDKENSDPSHKPDLRVLLVAPGPLDSNNGYQIQHLATSLHAFGAECIIAVPIDQPPQIFSAASIFSYARIQQYGPGFSDGRPPDIIHAWTPRENVRRFCAELLVHYSTKLLIHLEDNEEYLTEASTGKTWPELLDLSVAEQDQLVPMDRFHPRYGPAWLAKADGLTLVIDTLERFNVENRPTLIIPPVVGKHLFFPRPVNLLLRNKLGIPEEHVVLVYAGNVHSANKNEVGELYRAVDLLNKQDCPTTLIRTGMDPDWLDPNAWPKTHVVTLGWVAHGVLPYIMAAANFFVQPGEPGPFNDLRLPSKLPEYFAMGRPVVLPKTNLGLKVEHERDAYVLERADAANIVNAIQRLKVDRLLSNHLVLGAADFHRKQWDTPQLAKSLLNFYMERKVG